ncbi:CHAT domain-containing protein [Streptomyces sp. NPDC090046]|uniref:CHAT domain-containing protein n=1 Tax=Streptomyces sp. NPDC090046 TaxID=3365928 RepID=UPI00380EB535
MTGYDGLSGGVSVAAGEGLDAGVTEVRDLLADAPDLAERLGAWRDGTGVSPGALLVLTIALRATEAWTAQQINELVRPLVTHGGDRPPSSGDLTAATRLIMRLVRTRPAPALLRPALAARRDVLLASWSGRRGLAEDAATPWGPPSGLPLVPAQPRPAQDRALAGLFSALRTPLAVPDLGASQAGAPWRGRDGMAFPQAPGWMSRALLYGGEEQGRRVLGAVPWWYGTVDTLLQRDAVWRPRDAVGLRELVSFSLHQDRFAVFSVAFPQAVRKGAGPVEFSYTYDLYEPWDTAELTLAVRAGCARLDVLHIDGDEGLPQVRRTLLLEFPPDVMGGPAAEALETALGRHGDLSRVLPPRNGAQAQFRAADRVKSRDLAETLDLLEGLPSVPRERRARLRKALRRLEELRVERAERRYAAPGRPLPYRLHRSLQKAELEVGTLADAPPGADPEPLARALSVLGSDDRALAHLLVGGEGPRVVWARTAHGQARSGVLTAPDFDLEGFARCVTGWVRGGYPGEGRRAAELLLVPLLERLVQTLREEEGVRHLVLSPSSLFALLPLHAAPVPSLGADRLLADCFRTVSYAPSLASLTGLARRPLVLPAPPAFLSYGADLRGLATERAVLRRLYGGGLEVYTGSGATPAAVLNAGRTAGTLHIASHGQTAADPYASGLLLSAGGGGDAYDGRLTLGRVLREGNFDAAQLAVLANCSSGTHTSTRLGLERCRTLDTAFHARGVRVVLSTLWPLSDVVAPVLSAVLHAQLRADRSYGESFGAAVAYLRDRGWERPPEDAVGYAAEDALGFADGEWRARLRDFERYHRDDWAQEWACWKASGLLW